MKTITIRQHGETVYFLNSKGFQKGTIKRTLVVSEKHTPLEIKYNVTCPSYADVYMGDEIEGGLLFDSYEEMVKFYTALPKG